MRRGPLGLGCALPVVVALLTPAGAAGQSGYHYPFNYGFTLGNYPYYYSNVYPYNYLYPGPATGIHYQPRYHAVYYPGLGYSLRYEATGSSSPLWNGYQAFSPPAPSPNTTPDNTVTLDVRLPDANAEVWIDGRKTTQKGTARRFVSPPLEPGHTYQYEVRAQWTANGRKVDQSQKVTLQAGQRLGIDFLPVAAPR